MPIRKGKVDLILAKGETTAVGSMDLNIFIRGRKVPTHFLLLEGLHHDIVLGRPFLKEADLSIHIVENSWSFNSEGIKYTFDHPYKRRNIKYEKNVHSPLPVKDLPKGRREEVHKLFTDYSNNSNKVNTGSESTNIEKQRSRKYRKRTNFRSRQTIETLYVSEPKNWYSPGGY